MTKLNLIFTIIGFLAGLILGVPAGIYAVRKMLEYITRTVAAEAVARAVDPALIEIRKLTTDARLSFSEASKAITEDTKTTLAFLSELITPESIQESYGLKKIGEPIVGNCSDCGLFFQNLYWFNEAEKSICSGCWDKLQKNKTEEPEAKQSDAPDAPKEKSGHWFPIQAHGGTINLFSEIEVFARYYSEDGESFDVARAYMNNVFPATGNQKKLIRHLSALPFDYCRGYIVFPSGTSEVYFLFVPSAVANKSNDLILNEIEDFLNDEFNSKGEMTTALSGFIHGEVVRAEEFPALKTADFENLLPLARFEAGKKSLFIASAVFVLSKTEGFRLGDDFVPAKVSCYVVYESLSEGFLYLYLPFGTQIILDVLDQITSHLTLELKTSGVLQYIGALQYIIESKTVGGQKQ